MIMKIKVLIFLLLATVASSNAQYTLVPDPNFEDFLEANGMGDGVSGNGQVLTANIENVTVLDLDSQIGVTDLAGIEDFTALEWLDFSSNLVVNVDLSQNTFLKTLGCIDNGLISLNLSNNTQLEWLSCQGNQLVNLQLNSQYLEVIECFENYLSVLDVSAASALTELYCSENQLMDLDVSQNNNLILLNAWSNEFTSIDVSNNEALIYFSCSYSNISSIDISNNYNLRTFYASNILPLNNLDMRNGNNANINSVNVFGTDSLNCIFVDDATATYLDDWYKDPFTTFVNNEAECDALGTQEFVDTAFKIYPNPANTYFNISSKIEGVFSLFSIKGGIINSGSLNAGLSRISVEGLSSGLYFLQVSTVNGNTTQKIVVE